MTLHARLGTPLPLEHDPAWPADDRTKRYHRGALLSLVVVALWGVIALTLHLTGPGGMDRTEMILLMTLVPLYLVLIPFYWVQIRWAYPVGVLALLGLLAGFAMEVLDRVYVFSWSMYNVGFVVALVAAGLGIYLSLRSFFRRPRVGIAPAFATFGGLLILAAAIGMLVSQNAETIRRTTVEATLDRMEGKLDRLADLDAQLAYLTDAGRYPSLTAGIVVGDELVWSGAYGDAELDTVYEIGSVTKPFVAVAALQLTERGSLDLDADINAYLPFEVRHPNFPDQAITTRMLLSHTSGLAHFTEVYEAYHYSDERLEWLADKHGEEYPSFDQRPEFAEFLPAYLTPGGQHYTPAVWRPTAPGTEYSYSTIGYDLAAYLVGQVGGMPFDEYLSNGVLAPTGMTSTGLSVEDFPDRQAVSHWRLSGVLSQTNQALPLADFNTIGGGGLVSTVPDLARFMSAQLNGGTTAGNRLLNSESVEMMQTTSVRFPKGAGDLNQIGYGLGLGRIDTAPWEYWGHRYDMHGAIGHGGSTGASTAQMWFVDMPEGGYGFVLATNVDRAKPDYFDVWFFSTLYRMQALLMDEAEALYEMANS